MLTFHSAHDGDILPVLTALDLFPQDGDLPTSNILLNRTFHSSDIVPMGGRIILERVTCPATQVCWSNAPFYPNHVYCEEQTYNTSVRVNINDGIVAIPSCDGGPGSSCPLQDFVEMVRKRGGESGRFGEVCGLTDGAPESITFLHQ